MKIFSSVWVIIVSVSVSFALAGQGLAGPQLIHAGPMVGHVSDGTASIWIRVKHGTALTASLNQGSDSHKPTHFEDRGNDIHVIGFSGLKAATKCEVTVKASRDASDPEESTLSFMTYPSEDSTDKVRIAFGSCSKISQFPKGPIYGAIAKEQPDMMLFLGDNAYFIVADGSDRHFSTTGPVGDWNYPESMLARHLITRTHPDLQEMLRRVPSYGIWDDHDYGPNNADRTFELREEALRVFRQMWVNPAWGTPDTPGIFSKFRCGPVEVFLMDDRYYKYSPQSHQDVTPETGKIWGERQLVWLLESLKNSTAIVKVIANGTQFINMDGRGEGHYPEARGEQQRLLSYLAEHQIGGVVFLSGDRHHSEAMQQAQPDGTLVVEATSSPLQQDQAPAPLTNKFHVNQIWGMYGNNYGLLTIDTSDLTTGSVTFETRDASNTTHSVAGTLCKVAWTLPQLSYGADANVRGKAPTTWTKLFNGTNLEGWEQRNGTATFRIEGDAIVGKTKEGSGNSFLCTQASYDDFELKFEVKVDDALNSGVQIRSQSKADFHNGRVHGPQVEIEAGPGAAGYVYSEGTGRGWITQERPLTDQFKNGEWNNYLIRSQGNRIRTWVNGRPVADVATTESPLSGIIGLQVHGIPKGSGPHEVRWRKLYIKELNQ